MLDRRALEERNRELLWRAYAADPLRFFKDCVWVPSQRDVRGREKFVLFDYQEEDLRTLRDNRFVIGLKARQIGWSTLIAALLLHRCIFRPGSVCLWMSNNQDNANKAVAMLETMWHFLPAWVRERAPDLTASQAGKKEWTFPDGMTSRIRALAGTSTAGASETASIAVLDEFGLVDGATQDDLYRSVDSTTDAGGQLWILSTARGAYNRFANMFRSAERGDSKFVAMFRPWMVSRFVNPLAEAPGLLDCLRCRAAAYGRAPDCTQHVDRSVYLAKAKEFRDKPWILHAEYPEQPEEAFRESGNPRFPDLPPMKDAFDGWVRGRMETREVKAGWEMKELPVFVPDDDGPLRVREDVAEDGPDDWRQYVMFVDPAQGVGGDYTACHAFTVDDDSLPDIVAWWHHNRIEPVEAARQFDLLGRWLHGDRSAALLAVETTGGWGDSMLVELQMHCRYPNLYRHIPVGKTRRRVQPKVGFPMTLHSRPLVIDRLADYLREDSMVGSIHPLLRQELSTFVRTEQGRVQADVGCHDDLVMSAAGGLWVLTEEVRATKPPTGESPKPSGGRHSLQGLFDSIEAKRQQAVEDDRRALQRITRGASRSSRGRRRTAGSR